MELKIYSPYEDGFLKEIAFNHEEIKKELALRLEKYKGLTYSDKEIKIAKSDKAKLKKFKDALDEKRKEIKRQCLEPYEKFEIKMNEIFGLIDEPIAEIDKQVKAFEEKKKQEKRQIIEGVYSENIGDLKEILPIKKLWNDKWLNVTYKLSVITKEILTAIENTKKDLDVIESLGTEFELQIKDKYMQTLDLSAALAEKARLEQQKIKLEKYKKAQEAKVEHPKTKKEESIPVTPVTQAPLESFNATGKLEMLEFRVWVTPEQKAALKECILTNKIKCGKVR